MLVKLKDVCTFIGGSQPPKSTFIYTPKEGYIRLVQIRDRLNDNWATYIPENSTKKKCKPHEILIGRYGPPIFQVFRGFNGAYNVALLKAIPKENVNNDFLYYLLQQEKIVDFVNTNSKRTAGQWGVDLNMLYEYEVYLPNIEKQNKIANILLSIDNQIERNNAMTKRLQVMFNQKTGMKLRIRNQSQRKKSRISILNL